jgi:teichuronic acid biosynthesis glycosyltransferase TuaG
MPEVSIIVPCLNGMPFLKTALESVQRQSFGDWELIYVDNGSSDGSIEFARRASIFDSRVNVQTCSDKKSAAAARNCGLEVAKGSYISFLDCDDWWHPNKLEFQVHALKVHDAAFGCAAYQVCNGEGRPIRTQRVGVAPSRKEYISKRLTIGCLTAIYSRLHFKDLRFNSEISIAEDYLFFIELLARAEELNLRTVAIDLPLANYRLHIGGQSRNKLRHALSHWSILRENVGLDRVMSAFLLLSYAFNGIGDRLASSLWEPTVYDAKSVHDRAIVY